MANVFMNGIKPAYLMFNGTEYIPCANYATACYYKEHGYNFVSL